MDFLPPSNVLFVRGVRFRPEEWRIFYRDIILARSYSQYVLLRERRVREWAAWYSASFPGLLDYCAIPIGIKRPVGDVFVRRGSPMRAGHGIWIVSFSAVVVFVSGHLLWLIVFDSCPGCVGRGRSAIGSVSGCWVGMEYSRFPRASFGCFLTVCRGGVV